MRVEVLAHDAAWQGWYQALVARIWPVVAGLPAKPRVDIDVVAASPEAVRACVSALGAAGYEALGDLGVPGREALQAAAPIHPHNLYVCLEGSASLRNHLVLRDHLRAPQDLAGPALPRRRRCLL